MLPEVDLGQPVKVEMQETSRSGFALSADPLRRHHQATSVKSTRMFRASERPDICVDPRVPCPATCSPDRDAAMHVTNSVPSPANNSESPTKANSMRSPQLVDHLPQAGRLAFETFQLMTDNVSLDRNLGCSHQSLDTMICDCQYDPCKYCARMSSLLGRLETPASQAEFLSGRSRRTPGCLRGVFSVYQQTHTG